MIYRTTSQLNPQWSDLLIGLDYWRALGFVHTTVNNRGAMIDSDLAALLEWEAFGVQPMAGCARLLADPRFSSAARMLARNR